MFEGQAATENGCVWLDNSPCFYDGSGLRAQEVFKIFVKEGEEALWEELEDAYRSQWESGEASIK